MMSISHDFIVQLIAIARQAADEILTIYRAPETANIQTKSDQSPLTAADLAAHRVIAAALPGLLSVPLVSEEGSLPTFAERRSWRTYWLIDPLDGTKEFIARNGEFTVNIALVVDGVPLLGVVHVPVSDETYVGVDKTLTATGCSVAEKYQGGVKIGDLRSRNLSARWAAGESLGVLASHRHGTKVTTAFIDRIAQAWPGTLELSNAGSSLKFCRIAEGWADLYPRFAPTSEWDTAAAQAVLTASGGLVIHAETGQNLIYNQQDSIINPSFIALGDASFNWKSLDLPF